MAAILIEAPELMQKRSIINELLDQLFQARKKHRRRVLNVIRKLNPNPFTCHEAKDWSDTELNRSLESLIAMDYRRRDKYYNLWPKVCRLRDQTDKAIAEYATLSCRALCDTVQDKLPAEIRSQIYENVLDDRRNFYINFFPLAGWQFWNGLEDFFSNNSSKQGWPSYICIQKFVGLNTYKELAEIWYRTTSFVIWCWEILDKSHSLEILRGKQDMWAHTGLLINRIKNVVIEIDYELFQAMALANSDIPENPVEMVTDYDNDSYLFNMTCPRELADQFITGMEYFHRFCPRTKITFKIPHMAQEVSKQKDVEKDPLLLGLQFLFPTLSELRDAGMRIEALIDQTHINENFNFSAESWVKKVRASK